MTLRRVLVALACLMVVSGVVGAFVPRREPAGGPAPAPTPPAPGEPDSAVHGVLPRDGVVRARTGDVVELLVSSREPDSATIAALGMTDAAAPGAPARFSFLADRPGSFPVTLTLSGRRAGQIVVTARGGR